jgi:aminoglycoside phosphotransferase family enzyme
MSAHRLMAVKMLFWNHGNLQLILSVASIAMPASLQNKISILSQPSSYHDATTAVEVIETHMSWVFLTDLFAYKLKKPVVYDYLDFSTLEARHHFCQDEVRLNRRLAATVYLGVLPMRIGASGRLKLSGEGEVVEWLIKMRRMPSKMALDQCIRNHTLTEKSFNRLAEKLSRFYLSCRTEPVSPQQYCERFTIQVVDVIAELAPEEYGMPMDVVQGVYRKMKSFLRDHADLLEARALAGKIIEGHGDLRAEHVYLEAEPVVIDCLEFSKELRTVDAAYDMAFLALECERLGAAQEGDKLMRWYSAISGDNPAPELIHFYQTYQACSRARLALWHLKEEQYQRSPKWQQQANEWLLLAKHHSGQLRVSLGSSRALS